MTVLSLADAKAYINYTESDKDTEVQATIDAAVDAIGTRVGPLEAVAVTEILYASGCSLVLNKLPVISVTSITPYSGSALSLTAVDARKSGVVRYLDGNVFLGSTSYTVVYQAGWSTLPDDIITAVKELVRHLWATQRGSGVSRPGPMPSEVLSNSLPGAAYALPIRIEQLLSPYRLTGLA